MTCVYTRSWTKLLICPIFVIQWAYRSQLQPPLNAMHVESVITNTPCSNTVVSWVVDTIGLAFNTWLHQVVTTNGARLNNNIPRPECHSCPLLYFKSLFSLRISVLLKLILDKYGIAVIRLRGFFLVITRPFVRLWPWLAIDVYLVILVHPKYLWKRNLRYIRNVLLCDMAWVVIWWLCTVYMDVSFRSQILANKTFG